MAISWVDVSRLVPDMASLPVAGQDSILTHVNSVLDESALGDRYTLAAVYLAAHFGSVALAHASSGGGMVAAESVGGVSISYALSAGALGAWSTQYGRQFQSIVRNVARYRFGVI